MFATPAFAQAAGQAGGVAGFLTSPLLPFFLIIPIFYFLTIRPQQRRAAQHKAALEALKKGDEVVTAGGLIGRVNRLLEGEIELELAPTVRVRVVKSTLAEVRVKGAPVAANDAKS